MKKSLPLILLLALSAQDVPRAARGQSAQTQATGATQTAAATRGAQETDAQKEADELSRRVVQLYQAGKIEEALPLAERALAIREGALGTSDRRVAAALGNLAALRMASKDYDRAEVLYRRALAVYDAAGERESSSVMGVLDRLVVLSAYKREFDKAEASAQRLVAIAEKRYKPQQLEMAHALIPLAEVARLQRDNKRARTLYARIVDIIEQFTPASVSPDVRLSLANYLGLLYSEEGGKDSELTARINKLFVAIAAAASPGDGKIVEGGVINGRAVYKPQPEYPHSARSVRAQGTVRVKVTVDETGRVIEAKAFDNSPHPSLALASVDAARRARFTPTLLSGTPVKVNGIITYHFVLGYYP